jgi:5S rRNA maturation endonuclease (ribonuclease M5)
MTIGATWMSSSLERKSEEIRRLLDNLIAEAAKGTPIIVEGPKDKISLESLQVEGNIMSAKTSGKTVLDVLKEIENQGKERIILLMDFDREGREMTSRIAQSLENNRIKVDLIFWKKLLGLVGRDVKDVEGLSTYVQTLSRKMGRNTLSPNYQGVLSKMT